MVIITDVGKLYYFTNLNLAPLRGSFPYTKPMMNQASGEQGDRSWCWFYPDKINGDDLRDQHPRKYTMINQ